MAKSKRIEQFITDQSLQIAGEIDKLTYARDKAQQKVDECNADIALLVEELGNLDSDKNKLK